MEGFFLPAFLASVVVWVGLTTFMLVNRGLYDLRHRSVRRARRQLSDQALQGLSLAERTMGVQQILERLPRRTIERVAADASAPDWLAESFTHFGVERWGVQRLVHNASSHRTERGRWRRVAALRILTHAGHPQLLALLERAVHDRDPIVTGAALALLGRRPEPAAAVLLVEALCKGGYSRSRIATALEQAPALEPGQLLPLLEHENGPVRFWAATLLARFPGRGLDAALARLIDDPDANVRKAVVETLGVIGGTEAAPAAARLLDDPVWFVKAHAARALGQLGRAELAPRIGELLADSQWWVRLAAKQALESLGEAAWPALWHVLEHPDRFARNGAAEVLQNAGAVSALLRRGLAEDLAPEDLAVLHRVAEAGGSGLVEGLLESTTPQARPRLQQLLLAAAVEQTPS